MNKEDVKQKHNGILLSHKKERNLVICGTWIDPEGIMLRKIIQKEKDK